MSFFLSAPRPPRVLLMDPAKFRPPQNRRVSFGEKKSAGLPAREKKIVRFGAIFFLKKRSDLARNFFLVNFFKKKTTPFRFKTETVPVTDSQSQCND